MNKSDKSKPYLEQLVEDAMHNVGRQKDSELLDALQGMSHEKLDRILAPAPRVMASKPKIHRMTFVRLAVACALLVVALVGVNLLHLGGNVEKGNASLFNTYYKEYHATASAFDAAGDRVNAFGKHSTAAIIQDASVLINKKHSRHSLYRGIYMLEHLLTLHYKPSLAHEIHWYLALGYLKDNRRDKAVTELRTVIESERAQHINTHTSEAEALLKKIK